MIKITSKYTRWEPGDEAPGREHQCEISTTVQGLATAGGVVQDALSSRLEDWGFPVSISIDPNAPAPVVQSGS